MCFEFEVCFLGSGSCLDVSCLIYESLFTSVVDLDHSCQSKVASENVSSLWNPWVQLFLCESAELIVKLNVFFKSLSPDVLEKLPLELAGEWRDFFVDGIYNLMLRLPISITGVSVGFILGFYGSVFTLSSMHIE